MTAVGRDALSRSPDFGNARESGYDRFASRFQKAESAHRRALSSREKLYGADDPRLENSYFYLAILYRRQGNFPAARLYYEKLIAVLEKAPEPIIERIKYMRDNYATLLWEMGEYGVARGIIFQLRAEIVAATGQTPSVSAMSPPFSRPQFQYCQQLRRSLMIGSYGSCDTTRRTALKRRSDFI